MMSWDVASGECMIERADHDQNIGDFTFSQDQMTLIAASNDYNATVGPFRPEIVLVLGSKIEADDPDLLQLS